MIIIVMMQRIMALTLLLLLLSLLCQPPPNANGYGFALLSPPTAGREGRVSEDGKWVVVDNDSNDNVNNNCDKRSIVILTLIISTGINSSCSGMSL